MRPADLRPLVSVVITCRNQAHLLPGAVRSAVARAARIQIVMVDDGSTDRTPVIARGLEGIFLRQPERGTAAARNRGLHASTGEFVIFLTAADRLLDGAIDIGVRALASRPGCAMAYGRALLAGQDGTVRPARDLPSVRAGHHAALLQTNLIWTSAMAIFRRDAVQRAGGFVEELDGAAGYDLCLRISRDATIVDHGCHVVISGERPGASNGRAARMLHDTLEVMRRNCPDPHAPLYGAWREGYARWQEIHGTQLADEIRMHLGAGELGDAARKGWILVTLAPRVFVREFGRARSILDRGRQRRMKSVAAASESSNVPTSAMPSSLSRP